MQQPFAQTGNKNAGFFNVKSMPNDTVKTLLASLATKEQTQTNHVLINGDATTEPEKYDGLLDALRNDGYLTT